MMSNRGASSTNGSPATILVCSARSRLAARGVEPGQLPGDPAGVPHECPYVGEAATTVMNLLPRNHEPGVGHRLDQRTKLHPARHLPGRGAEGCAQDQSVT